MPGKYVENELKIRGGDLEARKQYRSSKKGADSANDIFMLDILREGIKNGDTRLQ